MKSKRSLGRPSAAKNADGPLSPHAGVSGVEKKAVHPVADVCIDEV